MTRVAFKTVGCRLNQAETGCMAAGFAQRGCAIVPFGHDCDICVVHTCAITATAERKCIRYARLARRNWPGAVLVLAGCAVELDPDRFRERTGADMVVGQAGKLALADTLAVGTVAGKPGAATPWFDRTRPLVKVQDGCDFRCTYCVVPDARGRPRSRPLPGILEEIRRLVERGAIEIVLTGANIGCYRDGPHGLLDLLKAVERIDGLQRMRISSIESTTAERDVIEFMASSRTLCRYLHLPLQSGDDPILRAMGRRYSTEAYRAVVKAATTRIPWLGIGSDVIVGFPGETDASFERTFQFIADLPFSNLHVFPYSARPGTAAAGLPGQVPMKERRARAARLIELGRHKRDAFCRSLLGHEVELLVETVASDGTASGWISQYVPARVAGFDGQTNTLLRFIPTDVENGVLIHTAGQQVVAPETANDVLTVIS